MAESHPKSGLRVTYRIETSDGQIITVKTALIDMLRWEKAHAGKSWLNDSGKITDMLWVAWAAGKRQGVIEGTDLDGWAASVVDIEPLDDESDEGDELRQDPTQPAPSA